MKTAVSISDDVFERAEQAARKLGMNRSQFYAAAVDLYAAEQEAADLTAAIDAVADAANSDASARFAVDAARRALDTAGDTW